VAANKASGHVLIGGSKGVYFGLCSAYVLHSSLAGGDARDPSAKRRHDVSKKKRTRDAQQQNAALQKDPDQWVTGDETMTDPQASYLHTLAQEAGESVDDSLTKAEASKKIDQLQEKTGRGRDH
jgi:hypothetical protein